MDFDSKTVNSQLTVDECYLHPGKKSALKCFKCSRTICSECVHYIYGCNYCETCAGSMKVGISSSGITPLIYSQDSLKYYGKKITKKNYFGMIFKYALRLSLLVLIIIGISNRGALALWITKKLPSGTEKIKPLKIFGLNIDINEAQEIPKRVFVQTQLVVFARHLAMDINMNQGSYPVNLAQYLRSNFEVDNKGTNKDIALDPWGTEYILRKKNEGYVILSAGPDRIFDTKDDIQHNF